jgi:hypothetical protein
MANESLAFLSKMGLAAAPAGQPIGLPTAAPAVEAAPVFVAPVPAQVAAPVSATPAPWMPPAAAQAAPVVAPAPAPAPFVAPAAASAAPIVGTATQGYGSQINPPESALAVVPAAPVVQAAPAPAENVANTPAESAIGNNSAGNVAALAPVAEAAPTKKGPGRPRKNNTAPEIIVAPASGSAGDVDSPRDEAPVDVAIPVVFHEPFSLHDRALIAVLPAAFEAMKDLIFADKAPPTSALELARAVVAPLAEGGK